MVCPLARFRDWTRTKGRVSAVSFAGSVSAAVASYFGFGAATDLTNGRSRSYSTYVL